MKKDEISVDEIDAVNKKLKSSSSSASSSSSSSNNEETSSDSSSWSSSWTTFSVPSWVEKGAEGSLQMTNIQNELMEFQQKNEPSKNKITYKKGLMKTAKRSETNTSGNIQILSKKEEQIAGPFTIMKDYSKKNIQERKQSEIQQEGKKKRGRPRKTEQTDNQNIAVEEETSDVIHLNDDLNEYAKQPSLSVEEKESSTNSTQFDLKCKSNDKLNKKRSVTWKDENENNMRLDTKEENQTDITRSVNWLENYYLKKEDFNQFDFSFQNEKFNQNMRGSFKDYTREYILMVYRFAHEYHQFLHKPKKINCDKQNDQQSEVPSATNIDKDISIQNYYKEFQIQEVIKNFDVYEEAFKTFINWWMNKMDTYKQVEDSFYENEILFTKNIDSAHIYLTPRYKDISNIKAKDLLTLKRQVSALLGLEEEHPLSERKEQNQGESTLKLIPSWKLKALKKEGDSSVTFIWSHHDPSRKSRWLSNNERESKYTLKIRNNKDGVTGWRFAVKFTRFWNVPHSFNFSYSVEKIQPLHNHELLFQGLSKTPELVAPIEPKAKENVILVAKKRTRKDIYKEVTNTVNWTIQDDDIGISKDDLFNKVDAKSAEVNS